MASAKIRVELKTIAYQISYYSYMYTRWSNARKVEIKLHRTNNIFAIRKSRHTEQKLQKELFFLYSGIKQYL